MSVLTVRAFADALKRLAPAVPSKPSLPVLACVQLRSERGNLQIAATDLRIGITTTVEAPDQEYWSACANYKQLAAFVSVLPSSGTIGLSLSKDTLTITSGRAKHAMPVIDADEFPTIPSLDSADAHEVDAALIKAVLSVAYARHSDSDRPILSGVAMTSESVAAADGFRLSIRTLPTPVVAVFEPDALAALDLSKATFTLKLANVLSISDGVTETITRLIEGRYPDVGRVIPTTASVVIKIDREQLVKAAQAAAISAEQSQNILKLTRNDGTGEPLVLSAKSDSNTTVEVECEAIGNERLEIALNVRYLLEALRMCLAAQVELRYASAGSPLVVIDGTVDHKHVIMPMSIR